MSRRHSSRRRPRRQRVKAIDALGAKAIRQAAGRCMNCDLPTSTETGPLRHVGNGVALCETCTKKFAMRRTAAGEDR